MNLLRTWETGMRSLLGHRMRSILTTLGILSGKIEKKLGDTGRILIRWSGTEPKLRIMLEGEDQATIAEYAKDIWHIPLTDR